MSSNSETEWKFKYNDLDLSNHTVIIPSVAVGNVAQLACDLLISSLNMEKIASLYNPALIPLIGYNPYDLASTELSTSCEIYKCDDKKLVVLQFRAPLIYKFAKSFLEEILIKFKGYGIRDIIILTSSFAHENKHMLTSPFRYVANEWCPHKNKIRIHNWSEFSFEGGKKIYGGGFASMLYDRCIENKMPCLIIFKYCSEGDNVPDAYEMMKYCSTLLPLFSDQTDLESQLVQPVSWKLLYGSPPPSDIY